ncbi:MAG: hypothetical protein HYS73_00990 [Parcubacteria group bacterium]|nr:hypothetical protein [Parcubacteria group bacterium]
MKNIPKTQFIGAFFVILFLVAGFLFLSDFFPKKDIAATTGLEGQTVLSFATEAEKDSDNDGLKDWEEGLWKTDLENPDTDGDGTPDGEEVRNKRNPTKAGPDDEYKSVKESPLKDLANISEAEKSLTLTDIFARDFMTGYFSLKDAGRYTPETRDKFVKTLFASIDNAPKEKYTLADLTITQKSDAETVRLYGTALNAVAFKYRHLAGRKELLIIDSAVKQESREKLAELEPIIADYDSFIEEYRTLSVPLAAYEVHLNLLNVNAAARNALMRMSRLFEDPMGGAAGLNEYRKSAEDGALVVRDLKNFFEQSEIIFNNDGSGTIPNK